MKTHFSFKLLPAFLALFINYSVSAQSIPQTVKAGVLVGAGIVGLIKGKKGKDAKKDNASPTATSNQGVRYIDTSQTYDLSGKWEGYQINGQLIMYYEVCFAKIGDNLYSGFDYCVWKKNANNAPIQHAEGSELPNGKKAFLGVFKGDFLNLSEVGNIENSNWGLLNEKFRLIKNNDTLAFINGDGNYSARKFYFKRTGDYPEDYLKYVINRGSLKIDTVNYHNPNLAAGIRYNEKGYLEFSINNKTAINFRALSVNLTVDNNGTGIDNNDAENLSFDIDGNSKKALDVAISSNLILPPGSLKIRLAISSNGTPLSIKYFSVPTNAFFKTGAVTAPVYTSARMRAVSGYYGFLNNPYSNVPASLEPLVASGDKIAGMWKAIFLSMGYGEYKIDEAQGYTIGKSCLKAVEDKARNGDCEAIYLMFYACQMGLEGEAGKSFAANFLEKAANAGFKPAVYDYSYQFIMNKDYASAYTFLIKSYEMGVKKAAEVIGVMHEKGLSFSPDVDSAISWYKKGMAFGDPKAMLWYANLVAKGINDTPPDVNRALSIATMAAAKNCTDAMIFNGTLFEGKRGIAQNIPLAIKWYKAGAEQGDRQAMYALGQTYIAAKRGMVKDESSGFFWIKKAAELGSPIAMVVLSNAYKEGSLIETNVIAARYWYNQAVLNGYAQADATGLNAGVQNFLNFWKYADFSPSYIYVNEYGEKVADGDDGLANGFISGLFGSMSSYYGNQQQLIDGLQYICTKRGNKIYGGTVSSHFISNLYLKKGQSVNIKSYGIISTGMFSGAANADGLGSAWPEYRIVPGIPCSAVMAGIKDSSWQFIGQNRSYTAPKDGPLVVALNAIDYRNYKGYFDLVVEVPGN